MSEIIETYTQEQSEQKQLEVHLSRVQKYRDEGYAVIEQPNGEFWIYPNNSMTGLPDMSANPTKRWAVPQETPDNTYEIPAANDVSPSFSGMLSMDYGVYVRPVEWDDMDYDNDTLTARFDKTDFE